MGAEAALESGRLAERIAAAGPARDRWFFTGMALAAALTVFVGFARCYYLRSAFGGPPLPPLVHLHGVLFTAWILLFVTQTSLVAASRWDLQSLALPIYCGAADGHVLTTGWKPTLPFSL
jgi:hypothetical protein